MIKRILIVWSIANFALVGLASLIARGWYLGWQAPPAVRMLVELGLIMLPNLLLPIPVMKFGEKQSFGHALKALGWRWNGWRSVLIGVLAFILVYLFLQGSTRLFGESIPYQRPGESGESGGIAVHGASDALLVFGILLGLIGFLVVSVAAEETMFRGWIQGLVGQRYNLWIGLLLAALLFGLRHLPADLFYACAWQAAPQMWIVRQTQLYGFALILGLVRHFGKSTFASAITHALVYVVTLFG